jgi:YhcH/YjgK/YiaL family protein
MICARLSEAQSYLGIHPNLDLALRCLTPEFLSTVTDQRQELKGEQVYVTGFTYETLPKEDTFYEAHKRYLDIHLMLEGKERVDIAHPADLQLFQQEGDFYAYHGEAEQSLLLTPGQFLVVFPGDAHRIKIQAEGPEKVTKAVFKVCIAD